MILLSLLSCLHQPLITNLRAPPIPLYRSSEQGTRLFVEVDLGIPGPHYFMIDTGASISAIRTDIVQELELDINKKNGYLMGISGRTPWLETTVPALHINGIELEEVEFAVGVTGIPTQTGLVPVAGVLGNNVWQDFVVDIDYGREELRLHPSFKMPESAQEIQFSEGNILAKAELWYSENGIQTVLSNIDAGSSGLLLNADDVPQLVEASTQSKSTIMGVGSSSMNQTDNVLHTMRAPVQKVKLGGLVQEGEYDSIIIPKPPYQDRFFSLIGYSILEGNRLIIDYQNQKLSLQSSTKDRKPRNIHQHYLDTLLWSGRKIQPMELINLYVILDQDDKALDLLKKLVEQDGDTIYIIALADFYLKEGDVSQASSLLSQLSTDELLRQNRWGMLLLAYSFTGKLAQAEKMSIELAKTHPDNIENWLILADLKMMRGEWDTAQRILGKLRKLTHPRAFLIRQALISEKQDKHTAAIAHLRMELQQNPLGSSALWFLARLSTDSPYQETIKATIQEFDSLKDSSRGALDFLAAAYWELGEEEKAVELATIGKNRDCANENLDMLNNCIAWYDALVHKDLEKNLDMMTTIVQENPGRSDYIDTLSVLYRANGEQRKAFILAKEAMLLSGADPYMIWQLYLPN